MNGRHGFAVLFFKREPVAVMEDIALFFYGNEGYES